MKYVLRNQGWVYELRNLSDREIRTKISDNETEKKFDPSLIYGYTVSLLIIPSVRIAC